MFGRSFKPESPQKPRHPAGEQAVLLYLDGEDFDRMVHLSDKLTQAINNANVGMFDGNEIGGGETVLFMYGPDAEAIFEVVGPVLEQEKSALFAKALIRRGGPGSPQREVVIGTLDEPAQ